MELEDIVQYYQINTLEDKLKGFFPNHSTIIEDCLSAVFTGDILGGIRLAIEEGLQGVLDDFSSYRYLLFTLVGIAILSTMIQLTTNLFSNLKGVKYGSYIITLTVTGISLQCFVGLYHVSKELLDNLLLFVRLVIPTYLMALGAGSSVLCAMSWRQLIVVVIYLIEKVIVSFFLPGTIAYILIVTINTIWQGNRCRYLISLFGRTYGVGLKALIASVSGISFLQSMVAPLAGKLGKQLLIKPLEMLPGIGNAAEGMADLILGSAALVKNGVGVFLFLILCAVFLLPLVKLLLTVFVLRLAAALMGLVNDTEVVGLVNGYAEGINWLFRIVAVSVFLFLILLACMTALG